MKTPVYFISHGGGPWPWMTEARPAYAKLIESLQDIPRQLDSSPSAIVMVSAHWEEDSVFAVMSNARPPMLYDYYGFPEHTYRIEYPAPGSPELARRIIGLLARAGLPARADAQRGFDHGSFVPLALMYPQADIPIVQVSIQAGYEPHVHFELGRALAPLREENVLVVCSGLSYHNLREIRSIGAAPSAQFDAWLQEALVDGPADQRLDRLANWELAPSARRAHPREDHLVPLMVAAGAAEGEPAACIYHDDSTFAGITTSSFRFG
ncbi:class III extradiol ring-cleavage dioxygenase [Pusillimonas sp.]|uniref:DODA-type extradiol aromatic ring-opening family dioxygenase n=1 Tax=Pusillimonas sp. TaxID=3040095 RepID=UPI0029AB162F|nr:class III extradiol ring-cleavage dioxygenase [Pusillimonas sp.]MDX3893741.1 class III extradiol ring-cleavage dioxygenase [Pusillimonas sp.]